ncbi:type II toxin-antitoxin system RelE family toxin [Kocuria tytonis]|uniref:Type II toxin-antitoxin system RelE/ParE family toxin n=1 Tax=Kocuria tytonis TaxID=2054280 RepID=A0A495A979_9MICC|nr:type II toxin-antitoxin system RelE/ParE family toxin [Kocuria tytonis]RKQ35067.1 type II toxin-antitoxin system RelE/ParE family toxin [Kocuria tytonis]
MAYAISYAASAATTLRKLGQGTARRLREAIGKLARAPRPPGFIQLKGGAGEMRIWVGDHRVIYEILDGELVILVLRIGHRREVYR